MPVCFDPRLTLCICRHVSQGSLGLRHWCEQGDNLQQFGWNKHDGRHFGVQNILDRGVRVETSFVKAAGGNNGGDWTNRVSFHGIEGTEVSALYYVAGELRYNFDST